MTKREFSAPMRLLTSVFSAGLLTLTVSGAFAQPRYELTDLNHSVKHDADYGMLRYALSDQGQVLAGDTLIFNGVKTQLKMSSGALKVGGWDFQPSGTSIVGYQQIRKNNVLMTQAVRWISPSALPQVLVSLPVINGGTVNEAVAINASGVIAGRSDARAALWRNNSPTALSAPISASLMTPYDLNDSGWVVGNASYPDALHGFLHTPSGYQDFGRDTRAYAINSQGVVVGALSSDTPQNTPPFPVYFVHAARWDAGVMLDLRALSNGLNSAAYDLNDQAQIVGYSEDGSTEFNASAVVWINNRIYDLNDLTDRPNVHLTGAFRINESGQILAEGTPYDAATQSYRLWLLNPVLVPGDIDRNGCVDDLDLFALTQDFLNAPGSASGKDTDLNDDGTVDDFDLFTLTQHFLEGC